MKAYLEHANFTYSNLDGAVKFFQIAIPEFQIRHESVNNGRRWMHLGTDSTYLALNEAVEPIHREERYAKGGLNHLGFVVEDVEGIAERLLKNGYERSFSKEVEIFRIRDYFFDHEGNEYEFVQYLSEEPHLRNTYR